MSAKVRPNGVTRQAVLDYLIREADMDGLVTVSATEIGEALGVSQQVVGKHIHNLATEGLLAIGPASGAAVDGWAAHGPMNAIQLAEDVFA